MSTTDSRVRLMAMVIAGTSLIAIPGGLMWPEPAQGGETYSFTDIAPIRDRWWGLLTVLAVNALLNVPLLALATMLLVRRRGAGWATVGGVVMWVGAILQAVGVVAWAAAYYFPSDPALNGADIVNGLDHAPIFAVMIPGALLVVVGTVLQAVALWRSKAVPRWVPLLSAVIILTFVVPGNGVAGLITAIPMTAAALGIAFYVSRIGVDAPEPRLKTMAR